MSYEDVPNLFEPGADEFVNGETADWETNSLTKLFLKPLSV